ncbi:retrovirus-related pol polyprotein from transposon TNT 1-94 [Tanacetum coccineum]
MIDNISYLSEYEPYDGGYVSFGHGGGKITGKRTIKTGKDFKIDDTHVLLRTPRQHNMYYIDLNNIVPHKNLTCLVAKASIDETMMWHRRLGHPNFKTMNKLVRNNLVRGSTYWTFFLKTKNETSSILRNFIIEIENLKDLKVKIIMCDNGGEFKNREMDEFCTKKGIKREFSNARTPQQNGVAERRNRTLIEAARTMLTDAKLPVTFWAKAVSSACYVQNRVLVNKYHNKTPYELFNGRSPAIRFLRPFGCHIMILNTLDNLGKFDAKGDEGTSSTNISAHMETSNDYVRNNKAKDDPSKEQDSNADVSESSGNSNPTATLKDPLADHVEAVLSPTVETEVPTVRPSIHIATTKYITADQMEPILPSKVETEVPTISSLAATDSISIPTVSSSVPRIISRGGFSYPETSFLGNAMTFEDKLEDFFEDTTNSASLTEMEADLSNMETSIQAKNMEEYGFIATIHQKTDPDLLQYCLFSCFLSQEEPKKIFDALKDPSWVEAMQEELLQFKIQNVWVLVDCPKGVRPIGTKWVLKNKRDERGIVIRNKARLVAQRYTQEEGIDYEEVFAHVARIEAIRLFLAYASYMGFTVYQMDVKSAFLYATIDEDVYVKQPPGFEDPEFPDRVYRVKRLCIDSIKLLELGMVPYPNTYWIMAFKEVP